MAVMRLLLALAAFPIFAMFACSQSSSTLSEARAKATIEECFTDPIRTLVSLGPIVQKGQDELQTTIKYKVDNDEFSGFAIFSQDQSGKRFLSDMVLDHSYCSKRLPLPVK
jgi:hypothetical protein